MRKVILFIAVSLDGFIANSSGGVDWLNGENDNENSMVTFPKFANTVDTVIIGWTTYNQIVTELSPDEWVYPDMTSYVITHRDCTSTDNIIFTSEDPCSLIKKLKEEDGKNIWICGGANLIKQCKQADLIDTYYLSIFPVILGKGTRLFEETDNEIKLKLVDTIQYNGITDLVYEHR